MKLKIVGLLASCSLICAPFLCTSCGSKTPIGEPKILFGEKRQYYVELESQNEKTISVNGFSFDNLPSSNLSVIFSSSNNSITSTVSITDFNQRTKTFNISIKFNNCTPNTNVSGVFQFSCDGKQIPFSDDPFNFIFYEKINIKKPTSELAKEVVLDKGLGTTTFKNFTYVGDIISPDLIKCNFITQSIVAVESCKIVNLSKENKTFDVELSIGGASTKQVVQGNFEFYFNDQKLVFDGQANDFKLTFVEEIYIGQSSDNNLEAFYLSGTPAVISFTKFRFKGIDSQSQIEMVADFTNNGVKKTITPVITDFDTQSKTFGVNFTIDNENDIGSWKGTIDFQLKTTHESILKTNEMNFTVLYAVSEDYLDIQKVEEGGVQKYVLAGIKGAYPADTKFNTLLVPSQVSEIANSAFSAKIAPTGSMKTIKYLSFDKNIYLKKIGSQAFKDCASLTGNLILPSSVTEIGEEAFSNCTSFDGKLFIPANQSATSSPQLPIGASAFLNCKFKQLDISDYPLNFLPIWNLSPDNKILSGWNANGEIIVCDIVFDEQTGYKTTLKNQLLTYSLPAAWTFSKNE